MYHSMIFMRGGLRSSATLVFILALLSGPLSSAAAMASPSKAARAAIAQLRSTRDKRTNLLDVAKCAGWAKREGARMLFLPECLGFVGDSAEHTLAQADPPLGEDTTSRLYRHDYATATHSSEMSSFRRALSDQIKLCATSPPDYNMSDCDAGDLSDWSDTSFISIIEELRYIACESKLWISGGGVHTRAESPPPSSSDGVDDKRREKIYNTHVIIDDEGRVRACYRKIHLFDVAIPGKVSLRESDTTLAGTNLVVCDSPIGRLGLSICYDMRFGEMYVDMVQKMGAQVLLMPSAFTVPTGRAHWHALLRGERALITVCHSLLR
jgi:predicted amidohydrolase